MLNVRAIACTKRGSIKKRGSPPRDSRHVLATPRNETARRHTHTCTRSDATTPPSALYLGVHDLLCCKHCTATKRSTDSFSNSECGQTIPTRQRGHDLGVRD